MPFRSALIPLLSATLWAVSLFPAAALAQPRVVATIRPLHSLAAGVMAGIAQPVLLFRGGGSPHGASLRPTQARELARAALVFWGGETLEPHLRKSLSASAPGRTVLAMEKLPGLALLRAGEGGGHKEPAQEGRGDSHGDEGNDPHFWLDPRNAQVMASAMAEALSRADPERAAAYRRNADSMARDLASLEAGLIGLLAPIKGRPYLVFHDAYRYFEQRFGLRSAGAVSINPERAPGARRVSRLRDALRDGGIRCVFSEPQFPPRLLRVLTEGLPVTLGVLDPIGVALPPGKRLYFELMRNMGASFRRCLGGGP